MMSYKNLKYQNLVLGWIVLALSLVVLGTTSFLLIQNGIESWRAPDVDNRITANLFLTIAIIGFTFSVITICCSSLFLAGIKKHKPFYMIPYVLLTVIGFITCMLFFLENIVFVFLLPAIVFVYMISISCGMMIAYMRKSEEEIYDVRYNNGGRVETEIP